MERPEVVPTIGFAALGAFGIYIAFYIWQFIPAISTPLPLIGIFLGYAIGIGSLGAALLGVKPTGRVQVIFFLAFSALVACFFHVQNKLVWPYYGTDSLAFSHYGADLLLEGRNPYTESMLPSTNRYNVPPYFLTPLVDGTFESRLTYPALNFLLLVPMVLLGIGDARVVIELFFLLTVALLYWRTPSPYRLLVPFLLFIDVNFLLFAAGSVTDAVWVFFLVASVLAMRRPALAGALMGLAVGYKQTAWLLAPFLIIYLLRAREWHFVKRYTIGGAAAFLTVNLPFFLWNPSAYIHAVLAPLGAEQIAYGSGIVLASINGWLPMSSGLLALLRLGLVVLLTTVFVLWFDRLKHAFWVFPAILAFFGPRSLQNYFLYWTPVVLAVVLARPHLDTQIDRWQARLKPFTTGPRPRRIFATLTVLLLAGVAFGSSTAALTATDSSIALRLDEAHIEPDSGLVRGLTFTFENAHASEFSPNFFVRINNHGDKVFESPAGTVVKANGTTQVTVWARTDVDRFPPGTPLVVRVVFPGHAEIILQRPEGVLGRALVNPQFTNWTPAGPPAWSVAPALSVGSRATAALEGYQGFGEPVAVLRVNASGFESPGAPYAAARLVQHTPFPQTVDIISYPTFDPHVRDGRPSAFLGVEVNDGRHLIWFVIGAANAQWEEPPEAAYVSVHAPLHLWSRLDLNVQEVYERKGWPTPPQVAIVPILIAHYLEPGDYEGAFARVDTHDGPARPLS